MKRFYQAVLLVTLIGAVVGQGNAIPVLQLYIEGATYDPVNETWLVTRPSFTLWVIGNVEGFGTIYDVRLAAAVRNNEEGTITLTPTTTTLLFDPSLPPQPQPTANFPSPEGAIPLMPPNNRPLPKHDVYTSGVRFYEWKLGDMTLKDSPVGDFVYGFPASFPKQGQINAYLVKVSGFSWVHFDTYGYIQSGGHQGRQRSVFAPFSHDALHTPEPGLVILLMGGLGLLYHRRRRKKP